MLIFEKLIEWKWIKKYNSYFQKKVKEKEINELLKENKSNYVSKYKRSFKIGNKITSITKIIYFIRK